MERGPGWERFLDELFRRGGGPDGPDLGVLDGLDESDRERAFELLITAAAQDHLPAIQALGYLRDHQAVGPLRALVRRRSGLTRVYAAAALWAVCRDPEALDALCAVVTPLARPGPRRRLSGRRWGGPAPRAYAAAVLSQIDHEQARRALAAAIHDPEYLVRYHAWTGLAPILGRSREVWNYVCKPDVHHHVRARIDAALRRAGLA